MTKVTRSIIGGITQNGKSFIGYKYLSDKLHSKLSITGKQAFMKSIIIIWFLLFYFLVYTILIRSVILLHDSVFFLTARHNFCSYSKDRR